VSLNSGLLGFCVSLRFIPVILQPYQILLLGGHIYHKLSMHKVICVRDFFVTQLSYMVSDAYSRSYLCAPLFCYKATMYGLVHETISLVITRPITRLHHGHDVTVSCFYTQNLTIRINKSMFKNIKGGDNILSCSAMGKES
jgi:hypothetical protein